MQVSVAVEFVQGVRWYLVHTRPDSERKAELNLKRRGFATFLRRVQSTIRHARCLMTVRRSPLSRFAFPPLDIGRYRWFSINATAGSSLLAREGRPRAVPFGIVKTLSAHSDGGPMRLEGLTARGLRVLILSRPLAVFRATALRFGERQRIGVLLGMPGAAVPMLLDRRALAPAA
jgi:hypothetical protein